MRVLIVDDNQDKVRRVSAVLLAVPGVDRSSLDVAGDAFSARRKLAEYTYDLVVLDVALPLNVDSGVDKAGGCSILDALEADDRLRKPKHIIGLTSFSELLDAASDRFGSRLLSLVKYDAMGDNWEKPLRARTEMIVASNNVSAPTHRSDVAILCAVDVEMEAVLRLPWNWLPHPVGHDHTIYWRGQFDAGGLSKVAYLAQCPRMGLPAAAVIATKLIERFQPRILAMCGIAAGIPGKVNLGDVLIAETCWDWGSGKRVVKGRGSRFLQAPHQCNGDVRIREAARALGKDAVFLADLRAKWQASKPTSELNVRVGPIASGAAVIADDKIASEIAEQHKQLLGIDMEAYSVLLAAQESQAPTCRGAIVKAVVDFADPDKHDDFQAYGAYVSAAVLQRLIERDMG